MTQAYNLSQFANKVNSSGQADLSTAVTGTLPIANGGTNNGSLAVTAGGVVYTDGSKLVNVGAGTTGQVLQSNGASAPTWATASGGFSGATTVTSGTSITLTNTSTQVQLITMTTTGLSVTLPDATTLTAGGIIFCLVNNGQNPFDIKTSDGATISTISYGNSVSLLLTNKSTAAGTWTTVSSPYVLSVAGSSYTSIDPTIFCGGALLSSTLVILSYVSGDTPYAVAGSISGTTVTWGTPVQISTSTLGGSNAIITRMSNTTAAMAYQPSAGSSVIVGISVSGTTITYGSTNTLDSSLLWVYNVGDNVGVVAYRNSSSQDNWKAFTNSGTTLTMGTAVNWANNNGDPPVIGLDSSRFISRYPGASGARIYSVSGTTITYSATSSNDVSQTGGFVIPGANVAYIGGYKFSYNSSGTTINSSTSSNLVPGYWQGNYVNINGRYVGVGTGYFLGSFAADSTSNSAFATSTLSIPSSFYGTQPIWKVDSTTALTFGRSAGTTGYIGVKFIKAS